MDRLTLVNLLIVVGFQIGFRPIRRKSPEGCGPLESLLSYTPETAYRMIGAYGAGGRKLYMALSLTLDSVFPLTYPLWFSRAIDDALRGRVPAHSPWRVLRFVPFLSTPIDYAENACIVTMLAAYPARSETLARMASRLTTAKWVSIGVSVVLWVASVMVRVKHCQRIRGTD
jgi:hypothetical protein